MVIYRRNNSYDDLTTNVHTMIVCLLVVTRGVHASTLLMLQQEKMILEQHWRACSNGGFLTYHLANLRKREQMWVMGVMCLMCDRLMRPDLVALVASHCGSRRLADPQMSCDRMEKDAIRRHNINLDIAICCFFSIPWS